MTVLGTLFRFALGRRPPTTAGELSVPGLAAPVTVRRDKWGVPHIDAGSDVDAWFGVGFCHGQDRAFQLETLHRLCRGTLAEMVGPEGLSADRMSRRVGFRRAAEKQLPVLDADVRAALDGYARGATAGATLGLPDKPHEFVILGGTPTPWDAADVLAFLKLQSFFLPSNWDVELARLRTLRADGPDAVRALDPSSVGWDESSSPTVSGRGATVGLEDSSHPTGFLDRLAEDLAAFERFALPGGGSNNWAISGSRTLSGKPLLASDPHLAPHIPPAWYLAHVRTPRWAAAGATFAGAPGFPIGHNGHACWGVTAGLTDTTDLVLETLGPDGRTVKQPDGSFAPCEVVREVIRVKGRADVTEEIPVTPRGPVVSPMFPGFTEAVSLRASWLEPRPLRGFMDTHTTRDFETFRRCFEKWPVLPLNVVYADAGDTIGWQLVGDVPRRQPGANGTIPLPADAPGNAWAGVIPFDEMPFAANPAEGFVATANNPPGAGPFVGTDFVDGYRAMVIREELAKHPVGWTVADCMTLQQNLRSAPWAEMRDIVLSIDPLLFPPLEGEG